MVLILRPAILTTLGRKRRNVTSPMLRASLVGKQGLCFLQGGSGISRVVLMKTQQTRHGDIIRGGVAALACRP